MLRLSKKSFALMLLMLILWAGLYVSRAVWSLYQPINIEEPQRFQIKKGMTFKKVMRDMGKAGIVEDPRWLAIYARLSEQAGKVKAGLFEIPPGITQLELLEFLIDGNVIKDSIQFIEGTSYTDVLGRLKAHPEVEYDLPEGEAELMAFLGIEGHPEGQFFPDTYQFDVGTSASDLLKRAHKRLQDMLADAWKERQESLPLKTPYEALILASLVEKETGVPEERPIIAGVFVNRLNKGMRLETDPTVIYGLGKAYRGNLTRKHLRSWTPYNTYRISGLPPTPIALVGKEAIFAATQPDKTDHLYFVAKGDGSHYFSKTYREHQGAVAKYQLNERKKNYQSKPK